MHLCHTQLATVLFFSDLSIFPFCCIYFLSFVIEYLFFHKMDLKYLSLCVTLQSTCTTVGHPLIGQENSLEKNNMFHIMILKKKGFCM